MDVYNVSVKALGIKTIKIISSLLNPIKVIRTDKGLPRDWQGLAELFGISGEQIPHLQNDLDPTHKILRLWCERDSSKSTIKNLIFYLEEIDRFDVIDDIRERLIEDIEGYDEKSVIQDTLQTEETILTVDDVTRINQGLEPQKYDAFVLFADEDIDFATMLIDTMEKQYHLKLCVKDRDVIGGTVELDVIVKLISQRCNRLIVIISQSFLGSAWNKFFVCFAQSVGIDQRQRKIIPCLYSPCDVPPELSCYFMLDYRRSGKFWDFWSKLNESIKVPNNKQSLNRSLSQVHPSRDNVLPASTEINLLKIKKEGVKFNSMGNLSETEKDTVSKDSGFNATSSSNNITVSLETKKQKSKPGWLKKLLPMKISKSSNTNREKFKNKVAVPS